MLAHPSRSAAVASPLGLARSASVSISRDLPHVPVLAELAGQVAARRPERQDRAARQKMVEWLFSIGSTQKAAGTPVREELDATVLDPAHEAQPALPFMHPAGTWAHVALHPAVGPHVPITGVDHRLLLLAIGLVQHCLELESSIVGTLNISLHSAILSQWHMNSMKGRPLEPPGPDQQSGRRRWRVHFTRGGPEELNATVAGLLAAQHGSARPPKALIVPHAGYVYSGKVAAQAYGSLGPAAGALRRVLLLGPSHREWFRGLAIPTVQAFATPLGTVRVDTAAVSRLCALPAVVRSDAAHALEHSLEVQLPFLRHLAPAAEIVPVVAGDASPAEVAEVIEELWGGAENADRRQLGPEPLSFVSYRPGTRRRDRAGDRWGPHGSRGRGRPAAAC